MKAFSVILSVIVVLIVINIVPETIRFLKREFEGHDIPFYPVAAVFLILLFLTCVFLNDFGYRSEVPRIEVSQKWTERMGGSL
ncbi:MAG TPA: hypothetical protein ENH40_05275 [Nitrospirae bacterium]|nr:hypothetical protein [Nitrospirota bacterium]